jgi:hypothetical protein
MIYSTEHKILNLFWVRRLVLFSVTLLLSASLLMARRVARRRLRVSAPRGTEPKQLEQ